MSDTQRGYNVTIEVTLAPYTPAPWWSTYEVNQDTYYKTLIIFWLATYGPDTNHSPSLLLCPDKEFEIIFSLPPLKALRALRKVREPCHLVAAHSSDNKVPTFCSEEQCLLPSALLLKPAKAPLKQPAGLSSKGPGFQNLLCPDLS